MQAEVTSLEASTGTARRLSWWALLVMVFLVPLVMTDYALPGLQGRLAFASIELVKLSLVAVAALVSLAAWAWDLLRNGGRIRHSPVDWLILAWLVWVGVTTITAVHWPTALLGAQGRHEGLVTFAIYAVVYFLFLQFVGEPGRLLRLAQVLFWSSVVVAVYGLLQYLGVVSLPEELPWNETERAFSTYGNPNILGGFLVFSVAVALGLALHERRRPWRLLYWSGFGLCGLALLATFTRGAWIGAAASISLLGIMAWRQRTKMSRIDWIPAGVFAGAGIAVIVRSVFSGGEVTNFARRIASIFELSSGSGQTRTEIWQAAATAIKDRPFLGWGSDTFGQVFSKLKSAEYVRDAGAASGTDNAHDYPLHLAAGVGLIGAVMFFAIWAWAGVKSWRTVFGRSGESSHLLVGAFWAAGAGYLLHLVFGISVPGSSFLLWIALAVVLAPSAGRVTVEPRRRGAVWASAIVVLALLGIAGQGITLAADKEYEVASEDFSTRSLSERIDSAEQATRLNPLVSGYRSAAGAVRLEKMAADAGALVRARHDDVDTAEYEDALEQSFTEAQSAYRDAVDFTPLDYTNYVNLAAVYNLAGASLDPAYYQKVQETVEAGLEVMPLGTHLRVQLALALAATGSTDEAIETLEYCMSLDPRDGHAALELARLYQANGRTSEALSLLQSVETQAPGQPGVAVAIKALSKGLPLP